MKAAVIAEAGQTVRSRLLLELLDARVGPGPEPPSAAGCHEQQPRAGEHRDRDREGLDQCETPVARVDHVELVARLGREREHDDAECRQRRNGAWERRPRQGRDTPQGLVMFDSGPGRIPPIGV